MDLSKNYLLAGGIAEIVMHPTHSTLPTEILAESDQSFTMPLHHQGSSYSETLSCADGIYTVLHRVTLVGFMGENLVEGDDMLKLLREGAIADVALNSGANIRVGWSEKYGVTAPLRLVSSELLSGEKRLDYPLKKWVFESTDTSVLI